MSTPFKNSWDLLKIRPETSVRYSKTLYLPGELLKLNYRFLERLQRRLPYCSEQWELSKDRWNIISDRCQLSRTFHQNTFNLNRCNTEQALWRTCEKLTDKKTWKADLNTASSNTQHPGSLKHEAISVSITRCFEVTCLLHRTIWEAIVGNHL